MRLLDSHPHILAADTRIASSTCSCWGVVYREAAKRREAAGPTASLWFDVFPFGRQLATGYVFQNPRCRSLAGLAVWKRFAFAQSDLISTALGIVYSRLRILFACLIHGLLQSNLQGSVVSGFVQTAHYSGARPI
jgi:hypothetical protein